MSRFMCGPNGLKLENWLGLELPSGSRLNGECGGVMGVMGDMGDTGADRSGGKWFCGVQMEPNRLDMGERLRVPEKYGLLPTHAAELQVVGDF